MRNKTGLVFLLSLLAGCSSHQPIIDHYDMSSEALRDFRQLTFLSKEEVSAGDYVSLGDISGFSCQRFDPIPKRSALDQLRMQALNLGADHVGVTSCEERKAMDLRNNCAHSVTCVGQALVKQTQSNAN